MTLKSIRSNNGDIHYYTVMDQVADAVAEARDEKQIAQDTWSYLYDRYLADTDRERAADYLRAANEVSAATQWSLFR